jgi:tetratricopeptide (TPR) repeat protein
MAGMVLMGRVTWADEVTADGFPYGTALVLGIRNDKLAFRTQAGKELQVDLGKVSKIIIDKMPKFNAAEEARDSDAKRAAALYKEALQQELTNRALRPLGLWRSIGPTDADGRWTEAVTLFLSLYQTNPTEAVWAIRPTHIPAAGSSMLKESADLIGSRLAQFSNADAKKNLQLMQVDLYTKAGETKAAARLARELSGAAPEPEVGNAGGSGAETVPIGAVEMAPIEDAIKSGKYETALELSDKLLARATGDGAATVTMAKARAYAGAKQRELAAATYLRVAIFYPKSAAAPAALLAAADLQRQMQHEEEAKRLYKELSEKYADSPEAVRARTQ